MKLGRNPVVPVSKFFAIFRDFFAIFGIFFGFFWIFRDFSKVFAIFSIVARFVGVFGYVSLFFRDVS